MRARESRMPAHRSRVRSPLRLSMSYQLGMGMPPLMVTGLTAAVGSTMRTCGSAGANTSVATSSQPSAVSPKPCMKMRAAVAGAAGSTIVQSSRTFTSCAAPLAAAMAALPLAEPAAGVVARGGAAAAAGTVARPAASTCALRRRGSGIDAEAAGAAAMTATTAHRATTAARAAAVPLATARRPGSCNSECADRQRGASITMPGAGACCGRRAPRGPHARRGKAPQPASMRWQSAP